MDLQGGYCCQECTQGVHMVHKVFANVALLCAPYAHLVCLPGRILLPADPCYTLLGLATPVRRGALPRIGCACSAVHVVRAVHAVRAVQVVLCM